MKVNPALLLGIFAVALSFFTTLTSLASTPPAIITYQGKVLVGSTPATSTLPMYFVLYDAPSGGNALYTAGGTLGATSSVNVTPVNGLFTINLGDTAGSPVTNELSPSIFQNNGDVYLEVRIGSETLSPRKRITAAPFAFNSQFLNGIAATSTPSTSTYIPVSDSSGNFNLNHVTSTGVMVNGNSVFSGLLSVTGTSTLATTTVSNLTVVGNTVGINLNDLTGSTTIAYLANSNIFAGLNTFNGVTVFTTTTVASSTINNANVVNLTVSGNVSGIGIGQISGSSTLAYLANNQVFSGSNTFTGLNSFFATTTFSTTTISSASIGQLVASSITLDGVTRTTWPISGGGDSLWSNLNNAIYTSSSYAVVVGASATSSDVIFEVAGASKLGGSVVITDGLTVQGTSTLATTTISSTTILTANINNLAVTTATANNITVSNTVSLDRGLLVSTAVVGASSANVIADPSFELGNLSNWSSPFGGGVDTLVADPAYGDSALRITTGGSLAVVVQQGRTVTHNTQYTYSYSAKGTVGGETAGVVIDGDDTLCGGGGLQQWYNFNTLTWDCVNPFTSLNPALGYLRTQTLTTGYQRFSESFVTDNDVTRVGIFLAGFGTDTLQYDGVQIRAGASSVFDAGVDGTAFTLQSSHSYDNWTDSQRLLSIIDGDGKEFLSLRGSGLLQLGDTNTTGSLAIYGGSVGNALSVIGNTALATTTITSSSITTANITNASITSAVIGVVAGNLVASANDTYSLGSPTISWQNIYATTGNFGDLGSVVINSSSLISITGNHGFTVQSNTGDLTLSSGNTTTVTAPHVLLQGGTDINFVAGGTNRMVIDSAGLVSVNGTLSVSGTSTLATTTATRLAVGTTSVDVAQVAVVSQGNTSSTAALALYNSDSTSLLTVRDNGNVGIGTATPSTTFQVVGTSTMRDILPEESHQYSIGDSFARWAQGWFDTLNVGTSTWSITQQAGGRLAFFNQPSGGGTETLSILNNGNVGINTSSPTAQFSVAGSSNFSGTSTFRNINLLGKIRDPNMVGNYANGLNVFNISVAGSYAYLSAGENGFFVLDVSNTSSPVVAGHADTVFAYSSVVSGTLAYLADATSFKVLDVSTPSSPTIIGSVAGGIEPVSVTVSGSYAYVADYSTGLRVIDISTPADPHVVGTAVSGDSSNSSVKVSGDYAYLASASNVEVVDISSPASPSVVFSTSTGIGTGSLDISGNYLYVTTGSGLVIFDITAPTSPVRLSTTGAITGYGIQVVGSNAYINSLGLTIVDISDPFAPSVSSANYFLNGSLGISVSEDGNYAYVAGGPKGVFFYNTTSKISPTKISSYSAPGVDATNLVIKDDVAFLLDGFNGVETFDISNPAAPTATYSYNTAGNSQDGVLVGNYLYVADGEEGLVVLDVSNPSIPVAVGGYSTSGEATNVVAQGKYLYVSASNSVLVFDISRPSSPSLINTYAAPVNPKGLSLSGNLLYIADGVSSSVRIVDVSNPHNLSQIGEYTTSTGIMYDVKVRGKYAYLADNSNGLIILDVSNPTTPTAIFSYDYALNENRSIALSGNYLLLGDNLDNNLRIFDVSAPSSTTLVQTVALSGLASAVKVEGNYAYIATRGSGFTVLDISGITISNTDIGAARISNLQVIGNSRFIGGLDIGGGLSVGNNGLLLGGDFGMYSPATNTLRFSSSTLFTSAGIQTFATNDIERLRIGTDGNITASSNFNPTVDGVFSLGTSTLRWKDLYISSSSLHIGEDGNEGVISYETENQYLNFSASTSFNGRVVIGTTTRNFSTTSTLIVDGNIDTFGSYVNRQADVAENYQTNEISIEAGDVVSVDPNNNQQIIKSSSAYQDGVVGIVSTNPAVLMGFETVSSKPVALAGRVPVKVSTVNGNINIGDKLTSSDIPGVAMKATADGPTVGIALEDYSASGVGRIVAMVNLGSKNVLATKLTVDANSQTITVGSSAQPYSLALTSALQFTNTSSNVLGFAANALFNSNVTASSSFAAFTFNANNFSATTSDNNLLSLRSNDTPVFSVAGNGDVHTLGDVYAHSAVVGTPGTPGDLAERVDIAADDTVEAGDVMVVDPNHPDTYRRSEGAYAQAVAGVISTNPTIVVGNGHTSFTGVLAMVGRVPVKVTNENGTIQRGDLLVAASTTGYAMRYDETKDDGQHVIGVIGIALEPLASSSSGKIMALIRAGWVNNQNGAVTALQRSIQTIAEAQGVSMGNSLAVSGTGNTLAYHNSAYDFGGNALVNVSRIAAKNNRWSIDENGNFTVRVATSLGDQEVYGVQSTRSELVFSSSSAFSSGEAQITFDPAVQEIIDTSSSLKVIVTLTSGGSKGIYVSEKNAQGFVVKELENGAGNGTFDWMIVAARKQVSADVGAQPENSTESTASSLPVTFTPPPVNEPVLSITTDASTTAVAPTVDVVVSTTSPIDPAPVVETPVAEVTPTPVTPPVETPVVPVESTPTP